MSKSSNKASNSFAVGIFVVPFAVACSAGTGADATSQQPLTVLAATSEAASQLNLASWELHAENDAVSVVGRDSTQARQTEMRLRRVEETEDSDVRVAIVFPLKAELTLRRDGNDLGTDTAYLKLVAAALHADLDGSARPFKSELAASDPEVSSLTEALTLVWEGHENMPWSLWGYSVNETVSYWCLQGTRSGWDAYSTSGASCWVNRWTTQIDTDCRIELHYGIAGWRSDTCNWFVYRNP